MIFYDEGLQFFCHHFPSFAIRRPICFIQLTSSANNISLIFDANTAEIAGRVVYGGNLDECELHEENGVLDTPTTIASISNLNVNVNTYKENTTSNISSNPLRVCICQSNTLECYYLEIETARGKNFNLSVVIVGQAMGVIPSVVRISLYNDAQLNSPTQCIQPTGKTCMNITYSLSSEKNSTIASLFPESDYSPFKNLFAWA